ncbi:hypothetical protein KY343_04965 [Candidatus Woesearchaeota archaeon]|nr:hypothetical protein [Candidatus Woesearchaeota archaeon]
MTLYTVKILENLETDPLGLLYFREFFLHLIEPDEPSQLELITRILSQRKFKERKALYNSIKERYEKAVSEEDYRFAERLCLMQDHYEKHILD